MPLAPAVRTSRTWLGQFFTALEAEDRQTALTGLQAAGARFQAVAKQRKSLSVLISGLSAT
ncbi:MAG TPA: hypothetical protein VLQ80_01405 [Candidatus Saccharimonadia bacterium]|nr:hypothetical protein [Candidatus Saccharimonadia bacterium]